jgi:hypothetical protein
MQTCTDQKPVDYALYKEMDIKNKRDPEHVASLLIITWDLINAACNVHDLKKYNWSAAVLCFLGEGLKKHDKQKPVTLSGCLILILVRIQYLFFVFLLDIVLSI